MSINVHKSREAFRATVIAGIWALCLFGETWNEAASGALGVVVREIVARVSHPRWLRFLGAGVYLAVFIVLEILAQRGNRRSVSVNGSLAMLALFCVAAYVSDYENASGSSAPVILLGGAAIGKGIAFLYRRGADDGLWRTIFSVVMLCAIASIWQPAVAVRFQYHGEPRWHGPWSNPNLFGLLMGTGLLLAVGLAVFTPTIRRQAANDPQNPRVVAKRSVVAIALGIVVVLLSRGLLHSYSRGAWVATLCGALYGALQSGDLWRDHPRWRGRRRNLPVLAVVIVSVGALAFWCGREVEFRPAERVLSLANPNDFSWRNRLASWEGALQIMADEPWLGAGWNRAERLFDQYYLPARLTESAAIQMNDYLLLGATLGIPALICFAGYLWLSLTSLGVGTSPANADRWRAVCRMGAVVLAAGFWFDGGLFQFPTAASFWILLELGRRD